MPSDTKGAAVRATSYASDSRVQHFWDLWKFGSRTYAQQLGIPEREAWDMFVFYKPHLVWKNAPPDPTFWMQARNLEVGEKYTQDELETKLKEWID